MLFDLALGGFYVLLIGLVAVQYYRGRISSQRVPLLLGMCGTWLAYVLLQITRDGLVPIGPPLEYVLDGIAVALLVAGFYGIYWWWRHRGRPDGGSSSTTR